MPVCRECNIEVEGKFCGECGANVDSAPATPQQETKTVQFCDACNVESDGGKFCGECGGALSEKEVEVTVKKSTGASGGGLSIFEQNALKQQKDSAGSNQVRDHKFAGSKPTSGYCGTFGDEQRKKAQAAVAPTHGVDKWGGKKTSGYVGTFGDDQRKKAQEAASPSKFNKFGGGAQTGYVGSFGDEQRKKAQANLSAAGGYNKFGGQKPIASGGSGMDFVTASNMQNQKIASDANRAGHDIVKSNDKKCEGAIDMQTANALEKQKMTNEANRTKDNIVMSKEKASNDGVLSVADSNALSHQKETSQALKRQDNLVKTSTGTGEAPHASGSAPTVYRCDGCDCERPEGKFCQECGTKLVAV